MTRDMMNKLRFLQKIGGTLLMLLLFAACSQDESQPNGTLLPEGKYPLELTAGGLEVTSTPAKASTRATYNGAWNGGEKVYVQIASSKDYADENNIPWQSIAPIQYTVAQDGEMTLVDAGNQRYWQSTDEKFYVRAWYPGTRTDYEDIPLEGGKWSAHADQSDENNMAQDDFLYTYQSVGFSQSGSSQLEFKHMMSKVIVNLESSEYLSENSNEVSVSLINCALGGRFWHSAKELRMEEDEEQNKSIAMRKITTNTDASASYDALVLPQGISDRNVNVLVKVGTVSYTWRVQLLQDNMFMGGVCYTFNITVDAKKLNVTVDSSNINWGPGNTGQGSIEIQ